MMLTTMSLQDEISGEGNPVANDLHLGLIRRRYVDKDVPRLHGDFGICRSTSAHVSQRFGKLKPTLRVDDWRHGQHSVLGVVDDRVCWRITDDGQVFCQMTIRLQDRH